MQDKLFHRLKDIDQLLYILTKLKKKNNTTKRLNNLQVFHSAMLDSFDYELFNKMCLLVC